MLATHMETQRSHISGKFLRRQCIVDAKKLISCRRCHGGDVYYTFGNLIRQGRPVRDNIDMPFSQFIVDLFTSFIRSSNPNPDPKYLHNRGYESTLEEVTRPGGIWDPVSDANNPTLRYLIWPADQITFQEISQCDVLGV